MTKIPDYETRDYKMSIYDPTIGMTGVQYWISAEEYRRAEEFLTKIGASRVPSANALEDNADYYLETPEQARAFGRFVYDVKTHRPRIGPPRLDMDIYVQGIGGEVRIAWDNEEEYQLGKKFMADMGQPACSAVGERYEQPESFFLESRQQYHALLNYKKELEKKRGA